MVLKENIITTLSSNEFKGKFLASGISHISLFGSYARDEATSKSDLDLVYELDGTFSTTFASLDYLEKILKKEFKIQKVDFVSKRKIHPFLKDTIQKDLITIF